MRFTRQFKPREVLIIRHTYSVTRAKAQNHGIIVISDKEDREKP